MRSTGALKLVANVRRADTLLILCYHGISLADEHIWEPSLYLRPDSFRDRLKLLRSLDANVLPLGEALDRLRARSLPPRSVAITFDDGFYDFAVHAVPALKEFGYPATLYLTTHYCERPVPIFNLVVVYLLWKADRPVFDWPDLGIPELPVRTYHERREVLLRLLACCEERKLDSLAKDGIARRLAERLSIDYEPILSSRLFQLVTPAETAGLARDGIDIEIHTHRHRTPRDRTLFEREINDNRDRIRSWTGRQPVHFCYPSGDYCPEFFGWLNDLGVRSATTCRSGLATAGSNLFDLPRLLDGQQVSSLEFEAALQGLIA